MLKKNGENVSLEGGEEIPLTLACTGDSGWPTPGPIDLSLKRGSHPACQKITAFKTATGGSEVLKGCR